MDHFHHHCFPIQTKRGAGPGEGFDVHDLDGQYSGLGKRSRILQSDTITIKNECSENLKVIVRYEKKNKNRVVKRNIRSNASVRLPRATSSDFYLYATGKNRRKVIQGNDWCVNNKKCLKQLEGLGLYSITCNGSPSTNPPPAPTPNPPPAPTPNPPPIPSPPTSGSESDIWLDAHNRRRLKYHNKELQWSSAIAQTAQSWANELVSKSGCKLAHDKDSKYGENLAANYGGNQHDTIDNILARWTENEIDTPFPYNMHRSQVLWKMTDFVGCAVASKPGCYIQVCRYVRPGNCNINEDGSNLEEKMLADSSPCGPFTV
uniref:SCP domain-containing protein n=1 Tax=Ditylum brightwellii TaxID=49249 RepID=A0A7S4VFV1_9STRA